MLWTGFVRVKRNNYNVLCAWFGLESSFVHWPALSFTYKDSHCITSSASSVSQISSSILGSRGNQILPSRILQVLCFSGNQEPRTSNCCGPVVPSDRTLNSHHVPIALTSVLITMPYWSLYCHYCAITVDAPHCQDPFSHHQHQSLYGLTSEWLFCVCLLVHTILCIYIGCTTEWYCVALLLGNRLVSYCIWTRKQCCSKADEYTPLLSRGRGRKCPELYGSQWQRMSRLRHSARKTQQLLQCTVRQTFNFEWARFNLCNQLKGKQHSNLSWSYSDLRIAVSMESSRTRWSLIDLLSAFTIMHFLSSYSSILNWPSKKPISEFGIKRPWTSNKDNSREQLEWRGTSSNSAQENRPAKRDHIGSKAITAKRNYWIPKCALDAGMVCILVISVTQKMLYVASATREVTINHMVSLSRSLQSLVMAYLIQRS